MRQFKYDRQREFLSLDAIREEQAQLLAEHIEYCRGKSPYYAKMSADVPAAAAANSFDILSSMPFTSKDDLSGNINSFVAAPECDIRDIAFSSGTTGAPLPIVYTENDLRRLAYNEQKAFMACGMTPHDKILLTCTMDRCFIAGLAYREGARAVGASVIRNGLNSLESHAGIIASMKPSIIIGVPSFLKKLIKFLTAENINPDFVKKLICIGEPVRDNNCQLSLAGSLLEELWGAKVYSTYASSETITSFCDCEAGCGGHLHHDLAILEIIDNNGNQCGPGEQGEVVLTPLQMEGMPLLRFKTGDISRYFNEKCACGRSTPRLGPVAGRKQQMMKINGTTVYPETVFSCLEAMPGIIDYYIVAQSCDGHLTQAEVTVSIGSDNALTMETISNRIAATARVRLPVAIKPYDKVYQQIFAGTSRKPVRFFIVDDKEIAT
ncbi:MAG: AMP-binding protein [Victivallaceae bacterium]|jgi:phenylacetate-CoA ligase